MADTTLIEINASAQDLEAAAQATKWTKQMIVDAIYPVGSLVFFAQEKTLTQVNQLFGTSYAWEDWGTMPMSDGSLVYVYHKLTSTTS